jgi:hypothetical protein
MYLIMASSAVWSSGGFSHRATILLAGQSGCSRAIREAGPVGHRASARRKSMTQIRHSGRSKPATLCLHLPQCNNKTTLSGLGGTTMPAQDRQI